jgi:hypothetical protein
MEHQLWENVENGWQSPFGLKKNPAGFICVDLPAPSGPFNKQSVP